MERSFRAFRFPVLALLLAGLIVAGCQSGEGGSTQSADSTATDGQVQQTSAEDAPNVRSGTYQIDGAHSSIGFRVRHMGISGVEGRFGEADATVTFPSGRLADMQAEATMQTASIDTGNDRRDNHLRSADFFNAEQYPEIAFTSTGLNPTGGGNFEMTGDLTMKDTTKSVTLDGEYLGAVEDADGNTHIGFEARGMINRQDFGLTWSQTTPGGELVVGDSVELRLDMEAVRQANAGQGNAGQGNAGQGNAGQGNAGQGG